MQLTAKERMMILSPDKGFGVVSLSKSDKINQMNEICNDQSKFKRLGPVSSNYNTVNIESRLQKRLLDLVKVDFMPK